MSSSKSYKNMHKILQLIICVCFIHAAQSQTAVWGLYQFAFSNNSTLDLRPDSTYIFQSFPRCGLVENGIDSGTFEINVDTITLYSNTSNTAPQRYLYISRQLSHPASSAFFPIGTIADIHTKDSLIPDSHIGRISDYQVLSYSDCSKLKGYYSNGKTQFETQVVDKYIITTKYYPSGQVQEITRYKKTKKTGDWLYFNESGAITKIETYKHNKLKTTVQ